MDKASDKDEKTTLPRLISRKGPFFLDACPKN
jgi:hypothetical protein